MAFDIGAYVRVKRPGLDATHPHRYELPVGAAGFVVHINKSQVEPCVSISVTGIDPVLNKEVTNKYHGIPERCLTVARN